ncbi:MAG: sporulation integral membrane protein YtvI [Oscillospiraceae bacterium]|nr:sporulation integral membrane protein YtvI [Oscillospiraceae bacterium]
MKIKKNWIKIISFVAALIVAAVLVYIFLPKILSVLGFLVELFLPFLLGYLFSMAVNPLADFLQRKLKIPRGLSAVLVIVLIVGILGGVLTFLIWKIIDEVRMLYTQFPQIYESVQSGLHSFGDKWSVVYYNLPVNVQEALSAIGEGISERAADFINTKSTPVVDYAGNFAKALPSVFIGIIVFILSSYFMVSENKLVSGAVNKLFSAKFTDRLNMVKRELKKYLGGYLKAQVILMFIAFVIMFIGMSVLNIDYALLIALGIAVLDALPFFGSGLVLWPWTVIEFLNGEIRLGIGLIIIYLAVALTRHFTEPKLVSSRIGMNPILTLMSMYIGYKTLSIGGLILGPIILVLIISFYKAGVFDWFINLLKSMGSFIKKQFLMFKKFLLELMESDWDE